MAAKKPAGIDMERNYVTVTLCILEFHYKVRGLYCLTESLALVLALIYKSLVLALVTDQVFGLGLDFCGPSPWPWKLTKSLLTFFYVLSMLSLLQINNTDFSHSLLKFQNLSAKLRHYNQSAFITRSHGSARVL